MAAVIILGSNSIDSNQSFIHLKYVDTIDDFLVFNFF